MNLISILIVAAVFIALCVFVYLARNTWHWMNLLFLMLTFIAGLAATIGLAQVGELRMKQVAAADKAAKDAARLIEQAETQVSGGYDSAAFTPESLRGVSQELSITMAGRGRVWSGGRVAPADDGTNRVFKFSKTRPAAGQNSVQLKDMVLFAFAEGVVPMPKDLANADDAEAGGNPVVPISYIGSVRVIEETPESLTVEPVFISNPETYDEPTSTWSLFEKMPLDRHETVEEAFRRGAGLDEDDEIDLNQLRAFLQNGVLNSQRVGMEPDSAEYEALLDRYTFDGQPLGTIRNWIEAQSNRISNRFDPEPEQIFVQYRFTAKSKKSYQVDANGNLATDGPFTPTGLAIEPALHVGKEVEFVENDTVLVDSLTAAGYSRNEGTQVPPFASTEPVEEEDRIYRRPLRDYPFMLASITRETAYFEEEIARRQRSNRIQTTTIEDTRAQLTERTNLTAALEADNGMLKADQQAVGAVLQKKDSRVNALQSQIEALDTQIDAGRRTFTQ